MPEVIAGRYRLAEPIGQDGGAEVWRGVDQRLDAAVAVKIVTLREGEAGERFTREARAAAQLMHPNVAKVLDVGADGDRRFLVMELLPGRTLATELAARGPLSVAEACHLLGQAAEGLAAAHRAGVVHGGLTAGDLHLAGYGVLKIAGFAHARPAPDGAASAAGDVFALGRVAYEALCGRPPFPGPAPRQAAEPVVPPHRHRPDLPAELDRLILAMLAEAPAARPTAEAVRRALGEIAARSAPPPPPVRPAVPPPPPAAAPAPARAGDTALLDRPFPADDPPPPADRRLLPQVIAAVAVIVAATIGAVFLFRPGGERAAAPTPVATAPAVEPSAAPEPTAEAEPTAEPATEPTVAAPPSPQPTGLRPEDGWEVWLSMFDRAVVQQAARGGMPADLAHKAHEKIKKAALAFLDGKPEKMRKEIRKLGEDLRKAREKGTLSEGPLTEFMDGSGPTPWARR